MALDNGKGFATFAAICVLLSHPNSFGTVSERKFQSLL